MGNPFHKPPGPGGGQFAPKSGGSAGTEALNPRASRRGKVSEAKKAAILAKAKGEYATTHPTHPTKPMLTDSHLARTNLTSLGELAMEVRRGNIYQALSRAVRIAHGYPDEAHVRHLMEKHKLHNWAHNDAMKQRAKALIGIPEHYEKYALK